jgi:hypothetical protein
MRPWKDDAGGRRRLFAGVRRHIPRALGKQIQLRRRHSVEREAVQGARAEGTKGGTVLGGRVPHMIGESVAGVPWIELGHESVTRDLGDDRGRGYRRTPPVASDQRSSLERRVSQSETVDERDVVASTQTSNGLGESAEVAAMQTHPIDGVGRHRHDRDCRGDGQDPRIEGLPEFRTQRFGIGEAGQLASERAAVVKGHRGRHERAGQATATGLVGAGDASGRGSAAGKPTSVESERVTERGVLSPGHGGVTGRPRSYSPPIFPSGQ